MQGDTDLYAYPETHTDLEWLSWTCLQPVWPSTHILFCTALKAGQLVGLIACPVSVGLLKLYSNE